MSGGPPAQADDGFGQFESSSNQVNMAGNPNNMNQ
tara:strand:+ start:225 stop:329 length:105 start_codon:yes stop_codon:yes gene_type:complete